LEPEIARPIVESLHLELTEDEIDLEGPLFGKGLGLDAIDAFELALSISRNYGLELKSDGERSHRISLLARSRSSVAGRPNGGRLPSGGPLDIAARTVAPFLSGRFGQKFALESRCGASATALVVASAITPAPRYPLGDTRLRRTPARRVRLARDATELLHPDLTRTPDRGPANWQG